MTVCIAALFRWNYSSPNEEPNFGIGAITASDRMITAADVQYEPQQKKIAYFGKSIVLVAGDIAIHSQAIRDTSREIGSRDLQPHDIALTYGRAIQAVNRRQAENEILAPLGLTAASFHTQQHEFSDQFLNTITSQLQNRRPTDVEALVVGSDGVDVQIYSIDAYGNETCLDAVGFGAIGIGAWHAKSRLMQVGHVNSRIFAPTLASVYAAKKNAEIAPGVGGATDISVVLRDSVSPLFPYVEPELERLYAKYQAETLKFGEAMVQELQNFINQPAPASSAAQVEAGSKDVAIAAE